MIIPIRCVSCGKVIGSKWKKYQEIINNDPDLKNQPETINVNSKTIKKTIQGKAMDQIGCIRDCCRRHILTHVDLTEII
tara:strand:- start:467 stop:703 length:237 start_codon:yes stop_codon:yes gene_type:complete